MPPPALRHRRRAEIGLTPRCRRAPAWSFRILTATESHAHRGGVRHSRRKSFAFAPGCPRSRAVAIGARTWLPRDNPRALTRAKSARRLATSRSDNPSYVRLLFALVTKS